jgi:hypothetical protein
MKRKFEAETSGAKEEWVVLAQLSPMEWNSLVQGVDTVLPDIPITFTKGEKGNGIEVQSITPTHDLAVKGFLSVADIYIDADTQAKDARYQELKEMVDSDEVVEASVKAELEKLKSDGYPRISDFYLSASSLMHVTKRFFFGQRGFEIGILKDSMDKLTLRSLGQAARTHCTVSRKESEALDSYALADLEDYQHVFFFPLRTLVTVIGTDKKSEDSLRIVVKESGETTIISFTQSDLVTACEQEFVGHKEADGVRIKDDDIRIAASQEDQEWVTKIDTVVKRELVCSFLRACSQTDLSLLLRLPFGEDPSPPVILQSLVGEPSENPSYLRFVIAADPYEEEDM